MESSSGPMLKPKQRKDGTWYAEASWPTAPTEDIGHFKSASDVRDWITDEADRYFQQRAAL
jgi:hypothetical protein